MADSNQQSNITADELMFMDEAGEVLSLGRDDLAPPPSVTALMDTGKEDLMLQPPPPVIRKATASFYFHPEDEEEAAKHKPPADLLPQKKYSLDKILERALTTFQLSLTPDNQKKLRAVVYSFLRDRRTKVETADVLQRQNTAGGLEFAQTLADQVLKFLTDVKAKIVSEKGLVIDESLQAEEAKAKPLPSVFKSSLPLKTGLTLNRPPLAARPLKPAAPAALKEAPAIFGPPPARTFAKRPTMSSMARKRGKSPMADIQRDYKLVGPVEELASLTLQTFRRLGPDAASQSDKVNAKVYLLGEQSLAKKSQGIQAWRRSPLYRMYLAIGQASMEHGLSVQKIIEQYVLQGKEILTLEEFEAISDLNKKFRF
ncbi:TPA: hypothetical protein DCL28_03970 [Candidatus Komeilibacteria bacterium]|nr:hypothetical protein [Candidatus Komeilibacteria bacterium]